MLENNFPKNAIKSKNITRTKILSKSIKYNNLLQKASLNTIKTRRIVIDFDNAYMQLVFCVGTTTSGGKYKQFKQKVINKNNEVDILNTLGIDSSILQNNILNFIEGEINATATN